MSNACAPEFLALEYRDPSVPRLPEVLVAAQAALSSAAPASGVPEAEVERRVTLAREAAAIEAEQKRRAETEACERRAQEQMARALSCFAEERSRYFQRVEAEVVQLALAIARKILQRETQLDPTLLAALVRIGLDRMQTESSVRIRVLPDDVDRWQQLAVGGSTEPRWQTVADPSLAAGDCIVETEMGRANFGFEAQLRDIEQSFAQLMSHRPEEV